MVSPYTKHTNTQLGTNNVINISGWCHHIQNIPTRNSVQIMLSIVYILTKILSILFKT